MFLGEKGVIFMNFDFSQEERMVMETAREFAVNELKPIASEIDRNHKIPEDVIKKLSKLGFFGVYVPEEYGGAGLSFLSYVLAVEEISKACASTGVMLSVHNSLACSAIYKFGTDEQRKKFLPILTSAEKIGCFMLTEPEAGSDVASLFTTVEKKDDYVINGNKIFVTNGGFLGYGILFATHDKSQRHKGISAFILDLKSEGVRLLRNEDKMGIRGTYTSAFALEDVHIPKENLLGKEGDGFKIAMDLLDGGRVSIAAQSIGLAQAAFEKALEYAAQRKQFSKPISSFQAIQFKLANMSMRIEASRLLTYKSTWLKQNHKNFVVESSMAKTYASETAVYAAKEALQIFGGYGYIADYEIERIYRDAKITEIYEGTNEIQRIVISKMMFK